MHSFSALFIQSLSLSLPGRTVIPSANRHRRQLLPIGSVHFPLGSGAAGAPVAWYQHSAGRSWVQGEQQVWFHSQNLAFGDLVLFGHRTNPRHGPSPVNRSFTEVGGLDLKPAALTPRPRQFLGTLTSCYSSCCSVLQPKPRPAMEAELLMEL